MIKKTIFVVIAVVAFGVIITLSTVTTRAHSDINSETNVSVPVNAPQGSGSNAQPDSAIKNWHEVD